MPDDLEQLQRKVEEGLAAARELKRMKAEQQRRSRPKLRLIKGGGAGAIWAGVEWLLDPRKIAVGLAAAAISTGAAVSDYPGNPGSDPPEATKPPATSTATKKPVVAPTVTPSPPRTSPLRTLGRSSTPVAAPTTPRKPIPSKTKTPRNTPTETPTQTPKPSLTQSVVPTSLVETPKLTAPVTTCVVDLLGVELCLPLGQS